MIKNLSLVKVAAAYGKVHVGNPKANLEVAYNLLKQTDADIVVMPELSITGYTCGDLFNNSLLLKESLECVVKLTAAVRDRVVVVGLPLKVGTAIYNCAVIINNQRLVGIVPKSYLPNYKEFYEARWFQPASKTTPKYLNLQDYDIRHLGFCDPIPFGADLLFECPRLGVNIGVEICEDIWAPIPPSSYQAIAGANILLNLSASNETVAKADYRRNMVEQQSGRCVATYVYCSSGPTESTTDLVFGGHCIVAENGSIVGETERFKDQDILEFHIDVEKLNNERSRTPTFANSQQELKKEFRRLHVHIVDQTLNIDNFEEFVGNVKLLPGHRPNITKLARKINPHPFVPNDPATLKKRCEEIFHIQVASITKRILEIPATQKYTIGISGGLDSTLAALVLHKAFKKIGRDAKFVDAITMPGFGTSAKTKNNSHKLMNQLGFSNTEIDIKPLCLQAFSDIKHNPFGLPIETYWDLEERVAGAAERMPVTKFVDDLTTVPAGSKDLTFENVQARIRTFLLMSRGFVVGTGDLSELALGWCTYNGDHMSMYNVNCSIPKTLVKFLVKYVAENEIDNEELKETLLSVYNTTVSPELLPLGKDGEIAQSTEDSIGPYELHDFFLFNFVRNNFAPDKILWLAQIAFNGKYDRLTILKWLREFFKRFFIAQFKRSCVPDGPKVGSVSLSPRGDWRMPSDASVKMWLENLGDN